MKRKRILAWLADERNIDREIPDFLRSCDYVDLRTNTKGRTGNEVEGDVGGKSGEEDASKM